MSAVLITNVQLVGPTGTEIVVRDLALALLRRGHEVAVYSPLLGAPAGRLAELGVAVVSDLDDVPFVPDVIHGHHHTPTVAAIEHFAGVPAIWVCHDRLQFEDIPPRHPAIRRYVAVDLNCRERLVEEAGISPHVVAIVRNAVDLDRFPQRRALTGPPRRALVFSNQARQGGYVDVLGEACAARQISLDVIGTAAGSSVDDPGRRLGDYDVVFAKARCALEALVSGPAVILADHRGFGGLVRSDTMDELWDWNFGMRTLQGAFDVDAVGAALDAIDATDARLVSTHMRKVANLEHAVDCYEVLYDEVRREGSEELLAHRAPPLATALEYASLLERRLRASGAGFDTVALSPSSVAHVRLKALSPWPAAVPASSPFGLDLLVVNDSREVLVSEGSRPVNISYHWRHADDPANDIFDGERTPLPTAVHPGAGAVVRLNVVAPPTDGRWLLHVTPLQELVMWFSEADPSCCIEQAVAVRSGDRSRLGLGDLVAHLAEDERCDAVIVRERGVATLSFVDDLGTDALTFVTTDRWARAVAESPDVAAVITTPALATRVPGDIGLLVVDDPVRVFYALHNALATSTSFYGERWPTVVHPTATIHPTAHVDPWCVEIGPDCVVGPGVVLEGRVRIGARTRIDANAVVGAAAFQRSGPAHGELEMVHAGGVEIGADCHVFANAVIARGQLALSTTIGDSTHIGNGAFVSHRCQVGRAVSVGHNATVNGRVTIGDGAWIGPGSVIAHRVELGSHCKVALGATVIHDVPADQEVAGLPALQKLRMFRHAASIQRSTDHTS